MSLRVKAIKEKYNIQETAILVARAWVSQRSCECFFPLVFGSLSLGKGRATLACLASIIPDDRGHDVIQMVLSARNSPARPSTLGLTLFYV